MRRRIAVVAEAALLSFLAAACSKNTGEKTMPNTSPVTAVYGFRADLPFFEGLSPEGIADTLRAWGVNAVFGGYADSSLVDALHRAGIAVYAELPVFVGEDLWNKYPCARPIKADGSPLEKIEWYAGVTPTCEPVRQQRLEQLQRLVAEHAVDGVWLDFIRWPAKWERPEPILPETSFDSATLQLFSKKTSIQLPAGLSTVPEKASWILSQHREEWIRFRCEVIREMVERAREICDAAGRRLVLGAFTVPYTDTDHDGALIRIVGQDLKLMGPLLDVISPMVYHALCGKDIEWIARITEWAHAASGKPIWPIVQSVDRPREISAEEFARSLRTALSAKGSRGVIIFTLPRTSRDKVEAMRRVFTESR